MSHSYRSKPHKTLGHGWSYVSVSQVRLITYFLSKTFSLDCLCSYFIASLLSCLLLVVVVFVVRCCADCCCHAGLFLLRVYDSGFKCVFEYFVQMYTCDQIYLSTFCVHFLCNDILLQTEHFSVLFQLSTVTYDLYLLVEFSINFPVQNLTCITIPKLFSWWITPTPRIVSTYVSLTVASRSPCWLI